MLNSVVQAQAQSPKLSELSPSCQSCHQGFTGPRAWALIFGSLRLWLQALSVYTDEFSVLRGSKNTSVQQQGEQNLGPQPIS